MTNNNNEAQLGDRQDGVVEVETTSDMVYFCPLTDEFIFPCNSTKFENHWSYNHNKVENWRKSEEEYSFLLSNYILDEQKIRAEYAIKIGIISANPDFTDETKKQKISEMEQERDAFINDKLAELVKAEKIKNENKKFISQFLPKNIEECLEAELSFVPVDYTNASLKNENKSDSNFVPDKDQQDYTKGQLANLKTVSQKTIEDMQTEYIKTTDVYEMYGIRLGKSDNDKSYIKVFVTRDFIDSETESKQVVKARAGSLLSKDENGKIKPIFLEKDPETGKVSFNFKKLKDTIIENKDFKVKLFECSRDIIKTQNFDFGSEEFSQILDEINNKLHFTASTDGGMFDITGSAQLMRFGAEAKASGEIDITQMTAELKGEIGGHITLASGAITANMYLPDRLGSRLYIPGLKKESDTGSEGYKRKDFIVGYIRLRVTGKLTAFAGAMGCISGSLCVGQVKDIDGDRYMSYLAPGMQEGAANAQERVTKGTEIKDKQDESSGATNSSNTTAQNGGAVVLSASAFAGAKAGLGAELAIEWLKPPEYFTHIGASVPDKPTFEVLLSGGFQIEGSLGIGAAATLYFTIDKGKVIAIAHAELCFGAGASGSLKFNIDASNIVKFTSWLNVQLFWAGYSYLSFINEVVFEFISELAVAVLAIGEDIAKFYTGFMDDLLVILKEFGDVLSPENTAKVMAELKTWWDCLGKTQMEQKCITATSNLLHNKVDLLKFTPEAKALLISMLIYDYEVMTEGVKPKLAAELQRQKQLREADKPWWQSLLLAFGESANVDRMQYVSMVDFWYTRGKQQDYENRCEAILSVFKSLQNERELECVLKGIRFIDKNGEKGTPVNDKHQGFARVAEYLVLDTLIDPNKCSSHYSQLAHILNGIDEGAPDLYGYALCYNTSKAYQLRYGVNPQYDIACCVTLDSADINRGKLP